MKKKIFEAVQHSKAELLTFTSYEEYKNWYDRNIIIGTQHDLIYYYDALSKIGIDIKDFPIEMSFTLENFTEIFERFKKLD